VIYYAIGFIVFTSVEIIYIYTSTPDKGKIKTESTNLLELFLNHKILNMKKQKRKYQQFLLAYQRMNKFKSVRPITEV